MKKNNRIKIFLGGYINATNAQNLNCRSLATHLNRERFDVGAMIYPGGKLHTGPEFNHVKKFKLLCPLYRPLRFVLYLNYLRGLLWCDVAYLPKGDIFSFCQKIAKIFRKKTFITVEGVLDKETYDGMMKFCGSEDKIRQLYNGYDKTYSITKFMSDENHQILNIKSDEILYLGVDTYRFKNKKTRNKQELTDIIFIGSDLTRKRVHEFVNLASRFPELRFHIAGGWPEYAAELSKTGLANITFHGQLSHQALSALLEEMDLHVFTSRSEGFPKVTLETAAAGVPSIVYSDYGAAEWITTGQDGFVVDYFDQIVEIISDLKQHPEKLTSLSTNAIKMAERFDWNNVIKDWENVIEQLVEKG